MPTRSIPWPLILAEGFAIVVMLSSCIGGDSATGVQSGNMDLRVTVQSALVPSQVDEPALPINRIRTLTVTASDLVLDSTDVDVSPFDDSWEVVLTVPALPGLLGVFIFLMNVAEDGTETIEFSGRSDPLTLRPGAELSIEIPLVRGTPCGVAPDWTVQSFEDPNLEAAVRQALSVGTSDDLTCGRLDDLDNLNDQAAADRGIVSLEGIQNLISVTGLFLCDNAITDISPLAGLQAVDFLCLGGNPITDLSPLSQLSSVTILVLGGVPYPNGDLSALSGLTDLKVLYVNGSNITNLAPLSGLTNLTELWVGFNEITDLSPLSGLTQLSYLYLQGNPITNVQPLLDNPGIGPGDTIDLRNTEVSCSDVALLEATGAVVIDPGGNQVPLCG